MTTDEVGPSEARRLRRRFDHPFWNGPFVSNPDETVATGKAVNQDFPPTWDVWVEKAGVPDSLRGPQGAPITAAVRMDDAAAAEITVEMLAFRMTAAIAGREAHEVGVLPVSMESKSSHHTEARLCSSKSPWQLLCIQRERTARLTSVALNGHPPTLGVVGQEYCPDEEGEAAGPPLTLHRERD